MDDSSKDEVDDIQESNDNPLQESESSDEILQPLEVKVVPDSKEYSVYDTCDSQEYDTLLSKDKDNIKKDLDIDG